MNFIFTQQNEHNITLSVSIDSIYISSRVTKLVTTYFWKHNEYTTWDCKLINKVLPIIPFESDLYGYQ